MYTIKDESEAASSNNITVATEGAVSSATNMISNNYGSVTYYSGGVNWFTIPLLAVGSHTLASHSTEALSELSSVGADVHTQPHQAAHDSDSAGALWAAPGAISRPGSRNQ